MFLSSFILSMSILGMASGFVSKGLKGEPVDQMVVTAADGILITNTRTHKNADKTTTTTITYSIAPSTADGYTLVDSLNWSNDYSSQWESATFGENEDPASYVTHSLDTSSKEITLTCLKPFGRSLIYTLSCAENTDIKASVNIDYVRVVTKEASGTFASSSFNEGEGIGVNIVDATYTIGSKGEKKTPEVTIQTPDVNATDWDGLFATIDLSGFSDTESVIYDSGSGDTQMKATEARELMKSRTKDYLNYIMQGKGQVKFSRAELIKKMTYKKKPNPYAGEVTYTSVGEKFIKNYKKLYDNGGGCRALLYVNGTKNQEVRFTMNVNAADISNITLSESQIDF
jgi:hypothetical protein